MTPTIIKGRVREIVNPPAQEDKPALVIEDSLAGLLIKVPATRWLLSNLPPIQIGDMLIITALVDADNRIMDAMTVLSEPPPRQ